MRKTIFLAALLVACSKAETPAADTAAMAMAPAAPAALTPADFKGTWKGATKAVGSDSVISHWTVVSTSDSTGTLTYDGTKTVVPFATVYAADSAVSTSAAFVSPTAKKGSPKVMFVSIGRIKDGTLAGTANIVLAAKPDSVLARHTFSATKAP